MINMESIFKTTIKKSQDKTLLTSQLKRTTKGVQLYLKSDIIEKFFNSNGIGSEHFTGIDGSLKTAYNMPDLVNHGLVKHIERIDTGLKNRNGYSNLSFLRCVGLTHGITFKVDGVYSRSALVDYMNELKTNVRNLYEYELKPIDLKCDFTIRENV